MQLQFSKRVEKADFQSGFTNEIVKAISTPGILSFAGGLPSSLSFPVEAMETAATQVLRENGVAALQYSSTQGFLPLREHIAKRYEKQGAKISPDEILITNGSQQALDLFGAVFIDEGDLILMERPSYLAAYQSFHFYQPRILEIDLSDEGIDTKQLEEILKKESPKFLYAIPNFQNPTGLSYSEQTRENLARVLKKYDCLLIEDNPYGELIFHGEMKGSLRPKLDEQCVMVGTFSKTLSPGMRIGWICCKNKELMAKLIDEKQRVDLHTNIFTQMIISKYLDQNDYSEHIEKIKKLYSHQAETMLECMAKYFPSEVTYTRPAGGMFLWVTLPEKMTAVEFGEKCLKQNVAVCPGEAFYENERNKNTLRLNYTSCNDEMIEKGIRVMGEVMREMMK